MNFRLSILAILLSTLTIIAGMHWLLNRDIAPDVAASEIKPSLSQILKKTTTVPIKAPVQTQANNVYSLNEADQKMILNLAKLDSAEILDELKNLQNHISTLDLYNNLADGLLFGDEKIQAKNTLERFALLGLETKRRKYKDIEPELNDAVLAHSDSLIEVRQLITEYN